MNAKFYFDIKFTNGSRLGGHNCTSFKTENNNLILQGYDDVPYVDGIERQHWKYAYKWSEIKEFKVSVMTDDETDYQI